MGGSATWRAAIEDSLTALVASGSSVRIDLDSFANPTAKERYEAGQIAVNAGLLTVNEWRDGEGLSPIAGGDSLRAPSAPAPEPARPPLEALPTMPNEEGA